MKNKLNHKQLLFCKEYLVDLNATQAAIRTGYSEKTARSQGQRLLTNVDIQERIQKEMDERSERIEITADKVLDEIGKLAFGNIKNIYDKDGKLIPIQDLPDVISAMITEITQDNLGASEDSPAIRRKYKIADKKGSLEQLGRHLKLFTEKHEHSSRGGEPVQIGINWVSEDYKKARKQMLEEDDY